MILRHCPVCQVALEAETYEGFAIQRCPQCHGTLLDLSRYQAIRSLPGQSLAKLEAEARAGFAGDSAAPLRCPRCHGLLQKQPLPVPGFDHLHLDRCAPCALVWLDGGELALAQLAHQASPAFRDQQELKRRHETLASDPERQAAFDEAVARLPLEAPPLRTGPQNLIVDALLDILRRNRWNWPRP